MRIPPPRYLALGDSYTIGEGVPVIHGFPYQVVQLMRGAGTDAAAPEIVARTGWTTGELLEAMAGYIFAPAYDMVSLLIGVNNQYRGLSPADYAREFEILLERSIALAARHPERVWVLSIPDWGKTPFAADRDAEQIAREIDAFNAINRRITDQYQCHYLDITDHSRTHCSAEYLAADGLHPSGKAYSEWAGALIGEMKMAYE